MERETPGERNLDLPEVINLDEVFDLNERLHLLSAESRTPGEDAACP